MDGEQVEAALSAARRGGLEPAVLHALDVGWLRRERPALLLTQDACLSCEAVAGTLDTWVAPCRGVCWVALPG